MQQCLHADAYGMQTPFGVVFGLDGVDCDTVHSLVLGAKKILPRQRNRQPEPVSDQSIGYEVQCLSKHVDEGLLGHPDRRRKEEGSA